MDYARGGKPWQQGDAEKKPMKTAWISKFEGLRRLPADNLLLLLDGSVKVQHNLRTQLAPHYL